jgi:hypothetical protein
MTVYTVKRFTSGTVTMSGPWDPETRTHTSHQEPAQTAYLYADGRLITQVGLNACTMCLPGDSVRGVDATDDQILQAVLGDEHIFSGAPVFPEHHDAVQP